MHFLTDNPAQNIFKRFTLTLYVMTYRVIHHGLLVTPTPYLFFKPLDNIGVKSNGNALFVGFNYCSAFAFAEIVIVSHRVNPHIVCVLACLHYGQR